MFSDGKQNLKPIIHKRFSNSVLLAEKRKTKKEEK